MLTNILCRARGGVSAVMRNQPRVMSDYAPSKYKTYHMDDFPVPSGSWQDGYKKRQLGNNAVLAFGIVFFSVSVYIAKKSELFFFNWIPELPTEEK